MTVMFCDLVGSTELSGRLDEEELRDILQEYHTVGEQAVSRYGGHVAQYLGDGLLVYFGYPKAHEDDAERAIRAGLDLVRDLAQKDNDALKVRIGIHTGPVVVGEVGGEHRRETLAQGETVNVAARLQGVAEPGSVVASQETLKLVQGIFLSDDLGVQSLKGVTKPMRAYRMHRSTGVRSRLDVAEGRLTPLVGRDLELGLLLDRWGQAQDGDGQVTLISGEAGLGKSRLTLTFRERLAEEPHTWLECRCSPYTTNTAFHSIIQLLEQGSGISDDDSDAEKLSKLESGLERIGVPLGKYVPLFANFLSIPLTQAYTAPEMDPKLQRRRTLESLTAYVLGLGEFLPVVVMVEDLQWCDPSSLELFNMMADQSPTSRLLLLGTARPEFESPWRDRSNFTPVKVGRLNRRQARAMAQVASPDGKLPDDVLDALVERAGGNPLYVEELTRNVVGSGMLEVSQGRYVLKGSLADLAIPDTLQNSLMARLDRMSTAKEVAQIASVLGREFSYGLLKRVSDYEEPRLRNGMQNLVEGELLYQRGSPPDASYVFKHALIHEAAYQSLLKRRRQELHRKTVDVLQEHYPEEGDSNLEMLAHHYEGASLGLEAAKYYRQAGRRSAERSANAEAVGHFTRGLQVLDKVQESKAREEVELRTQIDLSGAFTAISAYSDSNVEKALLRARELCRGAGQMRHRFRVVGTLSAFYMVRSELDAALELGCELEEMAQQSNSAPLAVYAHQMVGLPLCYSGKHAEALDHAERGVALYDADAAKPMATANIQNPCMGLMAVQGASLTFLGRLGESIETSGNMHEQAKTLNHPFSVAFATAEAIVNYGYLRESARCEAVAHEGAAFCEKRGFPYWGSLVKIGLGMVAHEEKNWQEAVNNLQTGIAAAEALETKMRMPYFRGVLASALAGKGDVSAGVKAIDDALSLAGRTNQRCFLPDLHRRKGEMLLQNGRDSQDGAESEFHRALDIARELDGKLFELRAATSLSRLWKNQNKISESRDLLKATYEWFTEGLETPDINEARALLAELV